MDKSDIIELIVVDGVMKKSDRDKITLQSNLSIREQILKLGYKIVPTNKYQMNS